MVAAGPCARRPQPHHCRAHKRKVFAPETIIFNLLAALILLLAFAEVALGDAFEAEAPFQQIFGILKLHVIFGGPCRAVRTEMPALAARQPPVSRDHTLKQSQAFVGRIGKSKPCDAVSMQYRTFPESSYTVPVIISAEYVSSPVRVLFQPLTIVPLAIRGNLQPL